MKARRVLITGAGGQLARALVATAPGGVELLAMGRGTLDIADAESVAAAFASGRPDVVLNTAAYTAVDAAEKDEATADRVNHRAVALLADRCRATGAKLVHLSTDYVFDGTATTPMLADAPTAPRCAYGRTKLAGERAALTTPDSCVVRTAWLYSPHGRNFMKTMVSLMETREEVRVVADQVGTPTSAQGLAQALWDLCAREAVGVQHWTDAGVASWYDFAVAIQEESAALGYSTSRARVVPISSAEYPTPAARPAMSVLSKDATWKLLGRRAPHWRVALRAALMEYATMRDNEPTRETRS